MASYAAKGMLGLTFELTPTAEASLVRPGGDDGTAGAARPYKACRSGSGVERVVRPHRRTLHVEAGLMLPEPCATEKNVDAVSRYSVRPRQPTGLAERRRAVRPLAANLSCQATGARTRWDCLAWWSWALRTFARR